MNKNNLSVLLTTTDKIYTLNKASKIALPQI